jgi:predicted DNA-binding transcriptional regulator AlpA
MKAPALSKSQPSPPCGLAADTSAKPWLAVDEVSASLGIGVTHLYALWKEGRGPHRLRIGRRVFVTPDALKAWIAELEHEQATRAEPARHLPG